MKQLASSSKLCWLSIFHCWNVSIRGSKQLIALERYLVLLFDGAKLTISSDNNGINCKPKRL